MPESGQGNQRRVSVLPYLDRAMVVPPPTLVKVGGGIQRANAREANLPPFSGAWLCLATGRGCSPDRRSERENPHKSRAKQRKTARSGHYACCAHGVVSHSSTAHAAIGRSQTTESNRLNATPGASMIERYVSGFAVRRPQLCEQQTRQSKIALGRRPQVRANVRRIRATRIPFVGK